MIIDNWYWVLGIGYWVLGIGYWVLVFFEQLNIDQRFLK